MQRVLFVDHVDRILGGAEINLVELLSAQALGDRWQTACACPPHGPLGRALARHSIRMLPFESPTALARHRVVGRRFSLRATLQAWRALSTAVARLTPLIVSFRPDVVVSCTNKDHFVCAAACRRHGSASVWWVNDLLTPDFFPLLARRAFARRARGGARRLVAVSGAVARSLEALRLPAERIVTIPNGIPLDRYRGLAREEARRILGLPLSGLYVGCIGRFTPWKGQRLFLEIARELLQQGATARFVLVGAAFNEDQAFEAQLRAEAGQGLLRDHVHFLPFQDDIVPALSALDILAHTAIRPEPFGRVLVEAMAVGVPVIAANAGGVPEIVTDGVDGALAPPGDCAGFASGLRRLLVAPEQRERMARRGRETVERRFDLRRVGASMAGLLDDVAAISAQRRKPST